MKVLTFKVFPTKSKWYYKVFIFHRKSSMQEFRRTLQEKDRANKMRSFKFEAACSSYTSKHKENKYQYGVLLFYKGSSKKSGVVSHEITHAATYWWKYMEKMKWGRIAKDSRADEKYAHIIGNMVAQYWMNWYSFYKKKS